MVDQVTITEEPRQEPQEDTTGGRPENVPEKFWDAEKGEIRVDDLLKSNSELERMIGSRNEGAEEVAEDAEGAPDGANADLEAQEAVEGAGLDFDALTSKYLETGALDAEEYAALEAKGISKDVVDNYIEGQQLKVEKYENSVFDLAGGKDKYNEVVSWAAENLSEAQRNAFDEAVTSLDIDKATFAVNGLIAQYAKANPTPPSRTLAAGPSAGQGGYQSQAEYLRDTESDAYWKDSVFRAKVDAKLAASSWAPR